MLKNPSVRLGRALERDVCQQCSGPETQLHANVCNTLNYCQASKPDRSINLFGLLNHLAYGLFLRSQDYLQPS